MSFPMQPAQFPHGGWVEGSARVPGSDQTYPKGTPVTWAAASQELDEHALGATVTNILGVSLDGCNGGEADDPSGKVSFAYASRSNVFIAKLTDGSGNVQTPDEANIGVSYGLLKNGSGADAWFSVNESDTTNVVVTVTGIDEEREIVYFKFLESAIQQP